MAGNGIDKKKAERFAKELNRADEELLSEKGAYMARIKVLKERKNSIYELAKDAGIPTKPFKMYRKAQGLEGKAKACYDRLEDDDTISFEQLSEVLGALATLPLGEFALSRTEQPGMPGADAPAMN
jgi:hypothetical protein